MSETPVYLFTFGCHTVHELVRHQGCKCLYIITGQHRLARFRTAECHKPQKTVTK